MADTAYGTGLALSTVFTSEEVGSLLGVKARTVRAWLERGELKGRRTVQWARVPGYRHPYKRVRWRVSGEAISEYLAKLEGRVGPCCPTCGRAWNRRTRQGRARTGVVAPASGESE